MAKQVIRATLTMTIENGGAELAKFLEERLSGTGSVWYDGTSLSLGEAFARWLTKDLIMPPAQASDAQYEQWADANIKATFNLSGRS